MFRLSCLTVVSFDRFILLEPRDKDHYNPIMCLENTLYTIIRREYLSVVRRHLLTHIVDYLTPEQQSLFGTLPDDSIKRNIDSDADSDSEERPRKPTVSLDVPSSTVSTPSSSTSDASSSSMSSLTSISSTSSVFSTLSAVSSLTSISDLEHLAEAHAFGLPCVDYLRLFRRALHNHDGPLFLKVMNAINALLRALKYPELPRDPFEDAPPNMLRDAIRGWPRGEIPPKVLLRIVEETYQRAVGPNVHELRNYEAFSSEVYGELLPPFVTEIIKATGLHADQLFLDLGSGVGNVVMQASLATGCTSYGIELMPGPAKLARKQLEQFRIRCKMWGVSMGDVELEEGDMLTSRRTDELIKKADVILVNNKVFLESCECPSYISYARLTDIVM